MINNSLKFSSRFDIQKINNAQLILHHAVQFIAAAGKYLLDKEADDSHTNMSWDSNMEMFYGGSINSRARVGLHIPSLSLKVSGPTGIELASFPLFGKTKDQGLIWLQQALQLKQIDTTSLELSTHYEIPEHQTDENKPFPKVADKILSELSNHRTLSDQICSDVFSKHSNASPPRTWPHHFDHGVSVPLKFDNEGNATHSFSVGYAVADSVINEPYFYVTQWKKEEEIDYSDAPKLEFGEWLPEKLNGAALSLSDILKMSDQRLGINSFIDSTIDFSKIK